MLGLSRMAIGFGPGLRRLDHTLVPAIRCTAPKRVDPICRAMKRQNVERTVRESRYRSAEAGHRSKCHHHVWVHQREPARHTGPP